MIYNKSMNINELLSEIKKYDIWPPAFLPGEPLWNDDYISRHMLKAHLDETNDRASYNKELRKQVSNEIISKCNLGKNSSMLDLGCGPGLYAQEFAQHGIKYTGIDISNQSLGYAMNHKGEYVDTITYIHGDYTEYDFQQKYDCITMIWCDFGALSPMARDNMLKNVASSLNKDGYFCFDVYLAESPFKNQESFWRVEEDGFWQKGKYLLLERNKYYETVNASLHMAIVAFETGVKVYRIWDKRYGIQELKDVLSNAGFDVVSIQKGGLSKKQDEMLGVYCRIQK